MLIRQLPPEANTPSEVRAAPDWTLEAHLLDDVRMELMALRGVEMKKIAPHPQRPRLLKQVDPEREKKLDAARQRLRARDRLIAAGEIT